MPSLDDEDSKEEGKACEEKESIADRVAKYFFTDTRFAEPLEAWVKENAWHVDPSKDEFLLKHTSLYEEFKDLYEGMLERYIESEGSTVRDFYETVRRAHDKDPDSPQALLGQIVLATTDFDIFIQMMRDYRSDQLLQQRGGENHK